MSRLIPSHRDSLLLEAGFLTVLVAPLNLLRWRSAFRQHDAVTFWLVRWLLFRLTFGSGVAKLASHCPSWWGLTGETGEPLMTHNCTVQCILNKNINATISMIFTELVYIWKSVDLINKFISP